MCAVKDVIKTYYHASGFLDTFRMVLNTHQIEPAGLCLEKVKAWIEQVHTDGNMDHMVNRTNRCKPVTINH